MLNQVESIVIFIPKTLERDKNGILEGFSKELNGSQTYFITNDKVKKTSKEPLAYISDCDLRPTGNLKERLLYINRLNLDIFNKNDKQVIKIFYDINILPNSLFIHSKINYGIHFQELITYFNHERSDKHLNGARNFIQRLLLLIVKLLGVVLKLSKTKMLSYSSTFTCIGESTIILQYFLTSLAKKHICPKVGNIFLARIVDILVGLYAIDYFVKHESEVLYFVENAGRIIIVYLHDLLTYLMGSPIGLKLNYAFNNALGSFFFYHITLWRVFLQGIHPFLLEYFHCLVMPGILGISFQMAMISDLLSFATFHVYCIYVYAAKLFQIQVQGITSLWRLFMGRKYNPLRNRVDSCQYSQHQLFIGTLGFTILLFLLPTTTLYYVVFTALRLSLLTMYGILLRARQILKCLPLYVLILWGIKSSSLAGCLELHLIESSNQLVEVQAELKTIPLILGIKMFNPDNINPFKKLGLGSTMHKVFTGVLI